MNCASVSTPSAGDTAIIMGDRLEIAIKVHRQVRLRLWQDHERGRGGHVERITVRLRSGGSLCGHEAGGAIAIDDYDLLSPALGEAIGDDARDDVGAAARSSLYDDRDVS